VSSTDEAIHTISVVVPVYRGETTLGGLVEEISAMSDEFVTPGGVSARVCEILLVFDHGPDGSARVIRELSAANKLVRPVWLSRNYGQHAATLAGMASSGGEWIVTLDEDGQYDPADIGVFLDAALAAGVPLVYANPTNEPPHGLIRNIASPVAKRLIDFLTGGRGARKYHSYRMVLGEIGRSVAAYAGSGVYLDVALGWISPEATTAPTRLRAEGRASGYSMRSLASHFWRLVLTSGTRGLRVVAASGVVVAFIGVIAAAYFALVQVTTGRILEGWTSLMVVQLLTAGLVLFSLGVIAEYVGVAVNMAMGRPPYLIVGDPADGPLGRSRVQDAN
jgi:undecaprenyl-phosphate 4-deoxy-4-formamido-L-arabinose transferase